MKKIGRLEINPEKVLRNEDLISLKGGWYNPAVGCCECGYSYPLTGWQMFGSGDYSTSETCDTYCAEIYPPWIQNRWVC